MEYKRYLITSALPYANGSLHLGHILENVQSDIYARFLRLTGRKVIFCCADDTHGTPIEVNAMKQGITPEELIAKYYEEHQREFRAFQIEFDSYYTTNSEENKKLAEEFFIKLREKGLIYKKDVEQMYCENDKRFLPDRFVKGKCPKCGAEDQYGDVCEVCSSSYSTVELINPYCALCKKQPVLKTSGHYFFKLSACSEQLKQWLENSEELQPEVVNFVLNWIKEGLHDWCISRDAPYFGFRIPGEESKYFYVWLDAPIGYISSTVNYCKHHNEKFEDYWKSPETKIIHNIGKDITYFHFLFWPAMLMNAGYNLPKKIIVHGFLNINDEKMSKSKGIGFGPRKYLEKLAPEYMRFYLAASLGKRMEDINLELNAFKDRCNNELVSNISNFFYRSLSFLNKNYDSTLSDMSTDDKKFYEELSKRFEEVKKSYEEVDYRNAIKTILEISSSGNKYFQEREPWKLVKTDKERAHSILTASANLVKDIAIAIQPVLPEFSRKIMLQLNIRKFCWDDIGRIMPSQHKIGVAEVIIRKIENEIEALAGKESPDDDFSKIDLKVARIMAVENHPDAEKLYVMQVDMGAEKRQLVAGLRNYYKKEELEGKNIIVVANLKPVVLRGKESKGMLLAADDGKNVKILSPEGSPGDDVFAEGIQKKPAREISLDDFIKTGLKVLSGNVFYKDKKLRTLQGFVEVSISDNARVR